VDERVLRRLRAFGTNVTVAVDDPEKADEALEMLVRELEGFDRACSRFRADSEIWSLYTSPGRWTEVSPILFDAVATALDVAERTAGAVDPTVGSAVSALGYDRDFSEVRLTDGPLRYAPVPAPGWWCVECDPSTRSVRLPTGVRLDLDATTKALAADRAASQIASATGRGALVEIGGDVAVSGKPPAGGWVVGISLDSSTPAESAGHAVSISSGGLASSSTVVRTWKRGDRRLHHIVDPATGDVASDCWSLVTVAASSCVDANAASTAAVVWGPCAPMRLESLGLPARLVGAHGTVTRVGGWPQELAVSGREHSDEVA
jgi:thiamine biosynthesis lipoprotein